MQNITGSLYPKQSKNAVQALIWHRLKEEKDIYPD